MPSARTKRHRVFYRAKLDIDSFSNPFQADRPLEVELVPLCRLVRPSTLCRNRNCPQKTTGLPQVRQCVQHDIA
jgi:hypothetical protein